MFHIVVDYWIGKKQAKHKIGLVKLILSGNHVYLKMLY